MIGNYRLADSSTEQFNIDATFVDSELDQRPMSFEVLTSFVRYSVIENLIIVHNNG